MSDEMDLDIEAAKLPHQTFTGQRLSVAEKLRILEVWDRAGEPTVQKALCHRIGVSPVNVASWAKMRAAGKLVPNESKLRSVITMRDQAAQLKALSKENERLKRDLTRAEGAVVALGKASELLTALAKSSQPQPPPPAPPMLAPLRRRPGK